MARRSKDQRIEDMETIGRLVLQGWSQRAIATEIGVSVGTINNDLQEIREQWRANAQRDIGEHISEQISQLQLVITEAWKSYHDASIDKTKHQYMSIIIKAQDRLARLLGTEQAQKLDITSQGESINIDASAERIAQLLATAEQRKQDGSKPNS